MKISAGILLFFAAAACSPSVPSEPTWVDDVRPILAANCIRCHSPPYIGGAPVTFRLDIYDEDRYLIPYLDAGPPPDAAPGAPDAGPDAGPVEPEPVHGARHESEQQAFRDVLVTRSIMPPRYPLTDRQVDVLMKWHEVSEPKGEPREGNAAPTMILVSDPEVIAGAVRLSYSIEDGDDDIVTGAIVAAPDGGGDPIVASNELFAGRGAVEFSLPAGTFALTAEIDDGQVDPAVSVELGQVVVP